MTLGETWYRDFWRLFQEHVRAHWAQWWDARSVPKWSELMFEFLGDMARKSGFKAQPEVRGFHAKRFDLVWKKDGESIVIEHENQHVKRALEEEVRKLAERIADLRVCISYIRPDEFPGHSFAERCRTVLEEEKSEGEFLLVLGSQDMSNPTDWVCHRFYPHTELRQELLVLASTISAKLLTDDRVRGPGVPAQRTGQSLREIVRGILAEAKQPMRHRDIVARARAAWEGEGKVAARNFAGQVWHATKAVGRVQSRGFWVIADRGR